MAHSSCHHLCRTTSNRCSFIFYCGKLLEPLDRDSLRSKIWDHYIQSEEGLKDIFGKIDWSRVRAANFTLDRLPEEQQKKISEALGSEEFASVRSVLPTEIPEKDTAKIQNVFGQRIQNEVNRSVFLQSISKQWVDYLTQIEGLRVSISMESYAQRNPLIVYKTKAGEMFTQLLNDIRQSVVERMFVSMPRVSMMTAVPHTETPSEPEKASETESAGNQKNAGKSPAKKAKSKK